MASIDHGTCSHEGFTPLTTQDALSCAGVALSDMGAREVHVMLMAGWTVTRQGVAFKMGR